ncbi:D-amino acid dehydrogenase small subunit [Alkalibacterium sp. AK22]|uniref:NAD(P)/FAD-dependent oxidoreductase n=1 Tax=Alkalibacterium sp. AK22 TaxID=1229520 RepID=UPI00044AC50B|nr:FAD-dependent oxidoreductase [Alkalibacterium sp. AK22]EXJ24001.1 D-amino acid dehydrogenase small subunit [Alkalibacterium sp. AK22]
MTKHVAIIGAGVVGASAAFELSKDPSIKLTIYDEGTGQGTYAAAGIISPWLSRRRNKKWYRMVKEGAAFYPGFLCDVMGGDAVSPFVYRNVGTLLIKKKPEYLREMLAIGEKRRLDAPEIGDLKILSSEEIRNKIPVYEGSDSALWASGGARVDGGKLVDLLLHTAVENGATLIRKRAELAQTGDKYTIRADESDQLFDSVVLSSAAWLPMLLEPLNYEVDIRPQKGQLAVLELTDFETGSWPVVMPQGEADIIPFEQGRVVIGATHENDQGFDLSIDESKVRTLIDETAGSFSQQLSQAKVSNYRSGTRAYTSDYAPFFGEVPGLPHAYAASGLGSTGLTAGPLVGKCLAQLVQGIPPELPVEDYPIGQYVKKRDR